MKKKNRQIRFGIFLILLSGVFFGLMLLGPFLQLETQHKVIWSTTSLVCMEVSFWVGGLLVGKELFMKYKARLNPANWFKKKME